MSNGMSDNFKYNVKWINHYKKLFLISGKELTFIGETIEDDLYKLSDFVREARKRGFTANQVLGMIGVLSLEDFKERANYILEPNHNKLNEAYNKCIQELEILLELDKSKSI